MPITCGGCAWSTAGWKTPCVPAATTRWSPPCTTRPLERLSAIDADLEHWAPGATHQVESPAAQAYRDRVAAASWGGALVAHHYTRYLGDLSGGQAIGKILDRTFDLDGAGLAFYEFPMRPKPYKDSYRARLDGLSLDAEEIGRAVDEVKVAFSLNQALFDELADNMPSYRR